MTRSRTTRSGVRWGVVLTGAALLGAVTMGGGAAAQTADDADTSATVGGNSNAPVIECAWALNDADGNWSGTPPMQYGPDDDPSANPGFPCQPVGGAAAMPNPFGTPVIHVLPNAHDEPTLAWVELWGAVTSSASGLEVYWDVYHPDGTHKVQIDGTRYAAPGINSPACNGPTGMFGAAQATGQLASGAITNIINECLGQQKSLWYSAFGISKHQPHGLYRIVMTAFAPNSAQVTQEYYVNVMSFFNLEKDFTNVQFGNVSANDHFWQPVSGDYLWDGTDNAANQKTSVRNTGNAGMGLAVRFHSMCLSGLPISGTGCTDNKRIDHFDAKFGKVPTGLQSLGAVDLATSLTSDLTSNANPPPAGPWYYFDDDINRTLCANEIGKIEFSIWTEAIQTGSYVATPGIGLLARHIALCPTDLGHPDALAGTTPWSNTHWL